MSWYGCSFLQHPLPRGLFLKSPETFRAYFGWHNSICIFKTKASRGTKLCSYFCFYSLYNIWKDQLYRISRSHFYEWLFGPAKFSGLLRNRAQSTTNKVVTKMASASPPSLAKSTSTVGVAFACLIFPAFYLCTWFTFDSKIPFGFAFNISTMAINVCLLGISCSQWVQGTSVLRNLPFGKSSFVFEV